MLNWKWDTVIVESVPITVTWNRYRRGPVTFYKKIYELDGNTYTEWFMYVINNLGFGIHLPVWLMELFK